VGKRTLYVSAKDEVVWANARRLDVSLSKLATQGLRHMLAEHAGRATRSADATAVARFTEQLNRLGWAKTGSAFVRACLDWGASQSTRAVKAARTKSPAVHRAAAVKAATTRRSKGGGRRRRRNSTKGAQ
jgi:hypothetical protein